MKKTQNFFLSTALPEPYITFNCLLNKSTYIPTISLHGRKIIVGKHSATATKKTGVGNGFSDPPTAVSVEVSTLHLRALHENTGGSTHHLQPCLIIRAPYRTESARGAGMFDDVFVV